MTDTLQTALLFFILADQQERTCIHVVYVLFGHALSLVYLGQMLGWLP